jgi:sugar phosphate isomerase/epimerase
MQLGIFAKTFPRPTLEETLDAVAGLGLTQVQFNMSCVGLPTLPERLEEDFCIDIARAHRERGLTMAAISGTFNMCDPDPERWREYQRCLDALAGACRWLDTRIITLCTGTRDPEDMWRWHPENVSRSTWQTLVHAMTEAVKIADRHEVTLAFEPEVNNVVNSVSKARRLLDEIDSPWLKVVIDPANLFPPGGIYDLESFMEEAFDWLARDTVLAHVKKPPSSFAIEEKAVTGSVDPLLIAVAQLGGDVEFRRILEEIRQTPELFETARWQAFYAPYFKRMRKMAYQGAVILHGVEENEAFQKISCLCALLSGEARPG